MTEQNSRNNKSGQPTKGKVKQSNIRLIKRQLLKRKWRWKNSPGNNVDEKTHTNKIPNQKGAIVKFPFYHSR